MSIIWTSENLNLQAGNILGKQRDNRLGEKSTRQHNKRIFCGKAACRESQKTYASAMPSAAFAAMESLKDKSRQPHSHPKQHTV